MCLLVFLFSITEGSASLLYGTVALLVLVNSCKSSALEVLRYEHTNEITNFIEI